MSGKKNVFSSLMEIAIRPEEVMVEGRGMYLYDAAGKEYLDFVQGWAVNCLGHCPEVVVEAVAAQAQKLINPSPAFYNDRMVELADLVTAHTLMDKVFFTNCGAEAVEGAIKLTRKWGAALRGGAYEIITFVNAFHGRTLACMSASGKPGWDALFEPKVPGFPKATLNDLESVKARITDKTAAVMLEPIQGEGGVIAATDEFLRELRALTKERGILLIVDEIQTGMGRTGRLFAHEYAGIEPDVMTLGKGIGGGVPLAALVAREEVCRFEPGEQGGTYNGNPLMAAAGCAVLRELTGPGFLDRVIETGDYLRERLTEVSKRFGYGAVRGRGLLLALDVRAPIAQDVVSRARHKGLLVNATRPDALRFTPALTVTREEIDKMCGILSDVFHELTT